jgi:outer membrane protein OmpA-like peptidoglycan-associated protein
LKRSRLIIQDGSPKVPGYIVTFSDMVTLLLTFFVLLLSLAEVQDPELFDKGRDAFLESIRHIGLGMLFGKEEMPHFGDIKTRHSISNPDESVDLRTVDAKAEELRRILEKLKQMTTIVPSQIVAERTNFSVANVHFSPGRIDLNEPARKFLRGFCLDLQQNVGRKPVELYVLGLASDGNSDKEKWLLSARRARTVADFLRAALSVAVGGRSRRSLAGGQSKWSVNSWGVGPGGDWVGLDSPISKHSQILIAVLRTSD